MKISRIEKLYIFSFFTLLPSVAMAFPLADGVSGVTTLIGVVSGIVASIFPSLKRSKFGTTMLMLFIGMMSIIIVESITIIESNNKTQEELDIVRQSRPESFLVKDITKREGVKPLPFTQKDIDFFNSHHLSNQLITLNEFKSIPENKYIEAVNIDFHPDYNTYQTKLIKGFRKGDYDSISDYANQKKGRIMLAGGILKDRVVTARKIFEHNGILVKILKDENVVFNHIKNANSDNIPYLSEDIDIFSLKHLYDLRGIENINETRTVFNADIATIMDLSLLPNWKIRKMFSGKKPVFVDFYTDKYAAANEFLSNAGLNDYHFVKGGLKHHFESGKNLTPTYYNQRLADPFILMDIAMSTDKLRFICTNRIVCANNIPKDMQVKVHYLDFEIPEFNQKIINLPKDKLYVTLSSNQETTGEAITVGYLLVNSGHNYLGELPLYERFSIEEIRHRIGHSYTYNTSLEEYRNSTTSIADYVDNMHSIINTTGWFTVFFVFGCALRALCTPLQIPVYRSYYFLKPQRSSILLLAMIIPAIVIFAYFKIDFLISYYGIVDHGLMNQLQNEGNGGLVAIFMSLVIIQAIISFPTRKLIGYGIAITLIALYYFGCMDALSQPMLAFLIGSELVAFSLQLPYYFSYLKSKRTEKIGYTERAIIDDRFTYPDKWRLLKFFNDDIPGTLVCTDILPDAWENVVSKYKSQKVIIRSCSSSQVEQSLGGFFESYVIDASKDTYSAILRLSTDKCSHAFIQPFVESNQTGVASSISSDGKGIIYAIGAPESATEGRDGVIEGTIPRTGKLDSPFESELRSLIFRIEAKYNSPVSIEFGISNNSSIILFQIRVNERVGVSKLFPKTIDDYELDESFLAKCSSLTGEMLEHVTRGNMVFIEGFMYQLKKPKLRKILLTEHQYHALMSEVEKHVAYSLKNKSSSPMWHYAQIKETLSIYTKIYDASMSRFTIKNDIPMSIYQCKIDQNSVELKISGYKEVELVDRFNDSIREGLHRLITLSGYLLNYHIRHLLNVDSVSPDISFNALISDEDTPIHIEKIKARTPLTVESCNKIIVPGEIRGTLFHASLPFCELESQEGPLVLIGEEIASDWVKYLDRFNGIISVYGHELSHLSISAIHLKKPYQKVSLEEYEEMQKSDTVQIDA